MNIKSNRIAIFFYIKKKKRGEIAIRNENESIYIVCKHMQCKREKKREKQGEKKGKERRFYVRFSY
jgi:hypothetical protein